MKIKNTNKKGFTLAEMMIVIVIIGIFSSMTVINFRGNEKRRELDNQALLLLDGIKRIQTSSLSGRLIGGQVVSSYIFRISRCSSSCEYELVANVTAGEIVFDTVSLKSASVDIVNGSGTSIGNDLIINISPPRGSMNIFIDGFPVPDEVIIQIEHIDDLSIGKKIKVNRISGRMDIVNN